MSRLVQPEDGATRWLPVSNQSGEDIPPFALMRITGISQGIITVAKPNVDGQTDILVNAAWPIPAGANGQAHGSTPCQAYYDTANVPAVGETWGAATSSWKLTKNKTGAKILGGHDADFELVNILHSFGASTGSARIESLLQLVPVALAPAGGTHTDYAPGSDGPVLRLNPAGDITIVSLADPDQWEFVFITNVSNFYITLAHDDGASGTAAMRFSCPGSTSVVIQPGGFVPVWYDSTTSRWRPGSPTGAMRPLPAATASPGSGSVNNWSPGPDELIGAAPSGDLTLTGMVLQPDGTTRIVVNNSAFEITFLDESGSSTAANRFRTSWDSSIVLGPDDAAVTIYDIQINRWRVYPLSQSWITLREVTPSSIGADQNDYDPGSGGLLRLEGSAAYSITGFAARPAGTVILVVNKGATYNITLKYDNSSSAAGNRIYTAHGGDLIVTPGSTVLLVYDGASSRWRAAPLDLATLLLEETSPSSIGANQNDYSPGSGGFVRLTSSDDYSITGVAAQPAGTILQLVNIGSNVLTLPHQDTGSAAANRIITPDSLSIVLGGGDGVLLIYDGTTQRWRAFPLSQARLLWPDDLSPAQITGDQNDYSPTGLATAQVLRLDTDASRTLTGLTGGVDGRVLILINIGSNALVLADQSGSSTAANRFLTTTGASITVAAKGAVLLYYDGTSSRWRVYALGSSGGGAITSADLPTDNPGAAYGGKSVPCWIKITKSHTDFQTAAFSNDIEIYSLPAKALIHAAVAKASTSFAGTGIATYDFASIGCAAQTNCWLAVTMDLTAAVSGTNHVIQDALNTGVAVAGIGSHTGTTSVRAHVVCAGAQLDQSTAGSIDFWLLVSLLP